MTGKFVEQAAAERGDKRVPHAKSGRQLMCHQLGQRGSWSE